jgi:hypothetical protein
MKKTKNNYAFIDSQNLNLSIRSQGWILDFRRFRRYINDKYGVTKAFLFIGYVYENQALYTDLQKDGYILVFKPTLKLPSGKVKGNVDAEIVLHAMIEYKNYLYCLVDYLIKSDKLLKLLVPNKNSFSSLFRRLMPYMAFMNDLRNKLEYDKASK